MCVAVAAADEFLARTTGQDVSGTSKTTVHVGNGQLSFVAMACSDLRLLLQQSPSRAYEIRIHSTPDNGEWGQGGNRATSARHCS
jgi:hypothetical protein